MNGPQSFRNNITTYSNENNGTVCLCAARSLFSACARTNGVRSVRLLLVSECVEEGGHVIAIRQDNNKGNNKGNKSVSQFTKPLLPPSPHRKLERIFIWAGNIGIQRISLYLLICRPSPTYNNGGCCRCLASNGLCRSFAGHFSYFCVTKHIRDGKMVPLS